MSIAFLCIGSLLALVSIIYADPPTNRFGSILCAILAAYFAGISALLWGCA